MTHSRIALVTGGNRGIGKATVSRLADDGWAVWLGTRSLERGQEALEEVSGDVRLVELDVTSQGSVDAARDQLRADAGRLDLLVNNAGIGGRFVGPEEITTADFLPVYGVNVLGPVRVTAGMLPLLRQGSQPRVVMVSSGLGSFGYVSDPERLEGVIASLVYPSSKAALNMVAMQYAKGVSDVEFVCVDPGYTATDFNDHQGFQTVDQAADAVFIACTRPDVNRRFLGVGGVDVPW